MKKNYYYFPSSMPRQAKAHGVDSMFTWTIFIFLLMGFALFCWISSFYIFGHPEKAANYHLLMRLHKLEEPQRFELTEAPRGEFLKPKQLLERFDRLDQREMRRLNDKLLANFLRNYHQTHDLTPYVTGTYRLLAAFPLTKKSFFYPGMCGLFQSVEQPTVLLEQVFPATNNSLIAKLNHASEVKKISSAQADDLQAMLANTSTHEPEGFNPAINFQKNKYDIAALQQVLTPGQEIKFEKPLDLSAILHVEKLPNGHIKLTTLSLLYGSYGPTSNGPVLFSLAPPTQLNIEAGLPVLLEKDLASAEQQYGEYRTKMGFAQTSDKRAAQPSSAFVLQIIANKFIPPAKKSGAKNIPRAEKATLPTAPAAAPTAAAEAPQVARALAVNTPAVLPATPAALPAVAIATPAAATTLISSNTLPPAAPLASKTESTPALVNSNTAVLNPTASAIAAPINQPSPIYDPGKMPRGRFVTPSQFSNLAEQGLAGERLYLQGDFAVTASGQDRSVLRYQSGTTSLTPDRIAKIRIIVTYPPTTAPPAEGTSIARNQDRPFMITDIKKGSDGTINIFARDIVK